MNKQLLNKILIFFLILIWSILGYKLISNFVGKEKVVGKTIKLANYGSEKHEEKKKIFVFTEIVRDPFLGNIIVTDNKKQPLVINKEKSPKQINIWPSIQYFGFVRGEMSDNPLALLKINNQLERIRQGSRIDGLYIKDIYSDSIQLVFGKEKKIFVKE
ncbi:MULTISPECIES: hypothetical protein [Aequorivita]|uniref:Uncharacterized protein n=1 Tax=Aequorivita iocasae TaxID=2803865 RepID=A0ABX7DRT7_9FLAO|nr:MULTISPECIES: hypothetical protein [Aequorivita]QQX76512.1 hypothetical protein JK629_14485 [Aequorivita iocasae]UCA55984.1 hypothetical protein LDL78_14555 [Aequorivita sp. F7]